VVVARVVDHQPVLVASLQDLGPIKKTLLMPENKFTPEISRYKFIRVL
jgi:hypothetical protein